MASDYLQLLRSVGVPIDPDFAVRFESAYPYARPQSVPEPTLLPTVPFDVREDGVPVFTSSQYDWQRPEDNGWQEYEIVETAESAHPILTSVEEDPSLLKHVTRGRRKHVYDRIYHFKWTLYHTLGLMGAPVETDLLRDLEESIGGAVTGDDVYVRLHAELKRRKMGHLYLSIPSLIQRMGGATWVVPHGLLDRIETDFRILHRAFTINKETLRRRRFPKLLFVVLALLDERRVAPPYRIPWAHTAHHDHKLAVLYNKLSSATPDSGWTIKAL
jgi:hypothetical protein